ncbi:hypothetical protein [uncultured Flavobacterium sp.]|uniref:hypothetical protein n=1 Tax=uncultured Flavobacterium sp. TaxID=165435 RepID=UPI0030CA393A
MHKKIQLLLIIIFVGFTSFGQQFIFNTTGFTVMQKNTNETWGNWSKLVDSEMIIKVDGESHRVIVYSEVIQLFSIIKYIDKVSNKTDDVVSLNCVDNSGKDCNVSIFTRKNQGNRMQLYIIYSDIIIAYNIVLQSDK